MNNNGTCGALDFTLGGSPYIDSTVSSSLTPSRGGHSQPSALSSLKTQPSQHPLALSQRGPSWGGLLHALEPPHQRDLPLEGVQEACLLRYFIEELSHWVSSILSVQNDDADSLVRSGRSSTAVSAPRPRESPAVSSPT